MWSPLLASRRVDVWSPFACRSLRRPAFARCGRLALQILLTPSWTYSRFGDHTSPQAVIDRGPCYLLASSRSTPLAADLRFAAVHGSSRSTVASETTHRTCYHAVRATCLLPSRSTPLAADARFAAVHGSESALQSLRRPHIAPDLLSTAVRATCLLPSRSTPLAADAPIRRRPWLRVGSTIASETTHRPRNISNANLLCVSAEP